MGLLLLAFAVAAALLAVAAAVRSWWTHTVVCACCCFALILAAAYLSTGGLIVDLPTWAFLAAHMIVLFLAMTAWSVWRDREKAQTGEDTR